MIELCEWPPTRSQRAKWALEELGIAYSSRMINMPEGEQDSDAYRAVHPLGVVPALVTDSYTMFEVCCDRAAADRRTPGDKISARGWNRAAGHLLPMERVCLRGTGSTDHDVLRQLDATAGNICGRPERLMTQSSPNGDAAISRSAPAFFRPRLASETICSGPNFQRRYSHRPQLLHGHSYRTDRRLPGARSVLRTAAETTRFRRAYSE